MPTPAYSPVDLARLGWYEQIQWNKLTPKEVIAFDKLGMNFLHYASRDGKWQHLPLELRDKKFWKLSKIGTSILMFAFQGTDNSWVDPKDLTEKEILRTNHRNESIIWTLISKGQIQRLPRTCITENVLRHQYIKTDLETVESYQECIVHHIARKDQIKHIPSNLLNETLLSTKGNYGESVYHILAERSQLHLLPRDALTKDALTIENAYGVNPLVAMAEHQPELIPKELRTAKYIYEDYLPKDKTAFQTRESPLQAWAAGKHWEDIPSNLLNKKSISIGSPDSPIDHILKNYAEETKGAHSIRRELITKVTKLLRLVETEELKRVKCQEEEKESLRLIDVANLSYSPANLIKKELGKRAIIKSLHRDKHQEQIIDV